MHTVGVFAGVVSTIRFVASHLPMLHHQARRTRDLSSYGVGNLTGG